MTSLLDHYVDGLERFTAHVHAVRADQWHAPTPCTDWDVRALVNHVIGEQLWAVPLLAGATIDDVGDRFDGDVLGEHPVAAWDAAAAAARSAFTTPGALRRTVHLSFGDTPADEYLAQMTTDVVVHGWDLARGIGADATIAADVAAELLRVTEGYQDQLAASGLFAPPVPTAPDADPATRLLARLGRRA